MTFKLTMETEKERQAAPNWVREGVADYQRITRGTITHGQFGRELGALVNLHGWGKVQPAFHRFLQSVEPRFLSLGYFCRTWSQWSPQSNGMRQLYPVVTSAMTAEPGKPVDVARLKQLVGK